MAGLERSRRGHQCSKVDYYDCVCIKSSAENHKVLILSTAAS